MAILKDGTKILGSAFAGPNGEFEIYHEGNLDIDGKIAYYIQDVVIDIGTIEYDIAALQNLITYSQIENDDRFSFINTQIAYIENGVNAEFAHINNEIDYVRSNISDVNDEISNLETQTNYKIAQANALI